MERIAFLRRRPFLYEFMRTVKQVFWQLKNQGGRGAMAGRNKEMLFAGLFAGFGTRIPESETLISLYSHRIQNALAI